MTTFNELHLSKEILTSLLELGFTEPTPIQEKTIPFILKSKKDLIALAQTGTGKTAAYSLPILHQIKDTAAKEPQCIILCPTRELCVQISEDIRKFAKHSKDIKVTSVYGGARMDLQIRALKNGTHFVVGTPGRVYDLIRKKVLKLHAIKWLVLDEADEMLDMGFKDDLDAILEQTPSSRKTFLFSATMSKSVNSIAKRYMSEAEEITVGEKNMGAEKVSHEYYIVQARDRFNALKSILDYLPGVYGILFCRTKNETQEIADKLKQTGYNAEAIHGDVPQNMRTKIMDRFKRQQVRLLVATDVAARGIDVNNLSHVINYNLPDHNETYTHRSGRTGRAQNNGVCITIITPREQRVIQSLENIVGRKIEYKKIPSLADIRQKQVDSFVTEIENTDNSAIAGKKYYPEIAEKLGKIKKEDLINYVISQKFNTFNDADNASHDLNANASAFGDRTSQANHTGLKINLGKSNGFDIKTLFGLINSKRALKGIEIGAIQLGPQSSVFSVDAKRAQDVIKNFRGSNFRGKKIQLEICNEVIARSKPDHFKRRPSGSSGNFKQRGRGFKRNKKSFD